LGKIYLNLRFLKFFGAKLLILPLLAFNALAASANIYKITFPPSRYVDQNTPDVPGVIEGFIIIDESLVNGDAKYQNGQTTEFDIPAWITSASLSFTPDVGSSVPAETRTLTSADPINRLRWQPTSGFDPKSEFVNQMTRFSLSNGGNFTASSSLIQQFGFTEDGTVKEGEFLLTNPVTPVQVPGPLPLLGLVPFAYYVRKFKKAQDKV